MRHHQPRTVKAGEDMPESVGDVCGRAAGSQLLDQARGPPLGHHVGRDPPQHPWTGLCPLEVLKAAPRWELCRAAHVGCCCGAPFLRLLPFLQLQLLRHAVPPLQPAQLPSLSTGACIHAQNCMFTVPQMDEACEWGPILSYSEKDDEMQKGAPFASPRAPQAPSAAPSHPQAWHCQRDLPAVPHSGHCHLIKIVCARSCLA